MPNIKYKEYIDIEERYFPCIDEAAINEGAPWENTYPHETFITLLTEMERALARQNNGKTLRIEGKYGTGKSQCAYALRKILQISEEELRKYWDSYDALKKKEDLFGKLMGHKNEGNGIVVANRYASGAIREPRELFFAIQESVEAALVAQGIPYHGQNTLKEGIIKWIDEATHKRFFDDLLQKPEWSNLFSQSTADEVLDALRENEDVTNLVNNIFRLAGKEGITALTLSADLLISWLTDVIDKNRVKIVLIWDEFSDYFRNNAGSLSEFQKIAALVQNEPFYFIIVTHMGHEICMSEADRGSQAKVSDRFVSITIDLPDNIAFDLIGNAFRVKDAAHDTWGRFADNLNSRVRDSRSRVMKEAKVEEAGTMEKIIPLHPMAVLALKHIATTFKSNQRSMFDFIKTSKADDMRAFQWFISETGPQDDYPLLTVDMLWHFFYEKGRDNLQESVRLILDTFPQQQEGLCQKERAVLKAILIMQALGQGLHGGIELFEATEQNLSYVFEGIRDLEGTQSINIAKKLKEDGILVLKPIGGGRSVYAVAVLAGDQMMIDEHKRRIRENATTKRLVDEGELSKVLSLPPSLQLRFETEPGSGKITAVTTADFTRTINRLADKAADAPGWQFHAIIAFAKDEGEAISFRPKLKEAAADPRYEKIVFIDALSTPLGIETFEQYVDFSAMQAYYQSNQNVPAQEYEDKAKRLLDQEWKNRIYDGSFIVYTYANSEGGRFPNAQGVLSALRTVVVRRFPSVFDFEKGLTESQLKMTQMKPSAKSGISKNTTGLIRGAEKSVLAKVWEIDKYWEDSTTSSLDISKIKVELNKHIEEAFTKDGRISIGEAYDFLEQKYGFAPCNLSAFIAGFLLKEYAGHPYRYCDANGAHEEMSQDKLAEMLANHIGKPRPQQTYIVKMTPAEMAFYKLTEAVWGIDKDSCSSAAQVQREITRKMRSLGLPVWCLEEEDSKGVYNVVLKYLQLVQKEGSQAHDVACQIGKIASDRVSLAEDLSALLSPENCVNGMRNYLRTFEEGRVLKLTEAIGAQDRVIADIRDLFEVKHACLWDRQTGEDEIRKLLPRYQIIKESNLILNTSANTLDSAYEKWRERLKFIPVSCETLQGKYPDLAECFRLLLLIYEEKDIQHDQVETLSSELEKHGSEIKRLFDNKINLFSDIYEAYLKGLSQEEIEKVVAQVGTGFFPLSQTESNRKVLDVVERFQKEQLKTQLFNLWREKTNTRSPRQWSDMHRTPILCLVSEMEFESAKKAFTTLDQKMSEDSEIEAALEFFKATQLFSEIAVKEKCDEAFRRQILGRYSILFTDIEKVRDELEELRLEVYDWYDNPNVRSKVKELAQAMYNAGGSDKVLRRISEMDEQQLRKYLEELIRTNIAVGVEVLKREG